jgi:hypothetical protein
VAAGGLRLAFGNGRLRGRLAKGRFDPGDTRSRDGRAPAQGHDHTVARVHREPGQRRNRVAAGRARNLSFALVMCGLGGMAACTSMPGFDCDGVAATGGRVPPRRRVLPKNRPPRLTGVHRATSRLSRCKNIGRPTRRSRNRRRSARRWNQKGVGRRRRTMNRLLVVIARTSRTFE